MGTLVIATSNLGKLDEFKEMFKELPVELKCLADYPPLPPTAGPLRQMPKSRLPTMRRI